MTNGVNEVFFLSFVLGHDFCFVSSDWSTGSMVGRYAIEAHRALYFTAG